MPDTNFNSYSSPQSFNNFNGQRNNNWGVPNNNIYRDQNQVPQYQGYPNQFNNDFLKGRLVTSIEEARAQSIALDGSISYFPDIGNKRIYTKQFNPDGTATTKIYVEDTSGQSNLKYVTQQELVDAIAGIKTMINNYILSMPLPIGQQQSNGGNSQISSQASTQPIATENSKQETFNI